MSKRSFSDAVNALLAAEDVEETAVSSSPSSSSSPISKVKKLGENGMPEFTDVGVGSNILALSQRVRGANDVQQLSREILSSSSSAQDVVDIMVLAFVTRNTRGGKGEKALSYEMFLSIYEAYPETGKAMLTLFPHYGYYKDLLLLMEMVQHRSNNDPSMWPESVQQGFFQAALAVLSHQFEKDMAAVAMAQQKTGEQGEKKEVPPAISLLAKWLPREGSRYDKKLNFVDQFVGVIWPTSHNAMSDKDVRYGLRKKYRKIVSQMTSYLDLPEVYLAARREDEIKFEKVASRATLLLSKVFLNVDKNGEERTPRNEKRVRLAERFVKHVVKRGAKGTQVMPHEIVGKLLTGSGLAGTEKILLDAQWKDLWSGVAKQIGAHTESTGLEPTRMIPMADVSGSMAGVPIMVSIALSIGLSEITHPAYKNLVLTFSAKPEFHRLDPADSVADKVISLQKAPWDMNTNFEAAYDLILAVAIEHKLNRQDVPSLIVFSDMQFDEARGTGSYDHDQDKELGLDSAATMHDHICAKFAKVAELLGWEDSSPTPIVYWNLRNTFGHPVDKDTPGAVLLSGFSPSLLKLVMQGDALNDVEVEAVQEDGTTKAEKVRVTPEEIVRKMLDDELYDPVRKVLSESQEGILAGYAIPGVDGDGGAMDEDFEVVSSPLV